MKLIYHGPLWRGGTALQRAEALAALPEIEVVALDTMRGQSHQSLTPYERIRWRLGWPVDSLNENARLLELTRRVRPDAIIVDNSKVIRRDVLRELTDHLGALIVYYSPDDIMAPHNLKEPLRHSLGTWDIVFTTKSYNLAELRAAGALRPILVGKSFDQVLHRPLSAEEVGRNFETFDLVFIGAFEPERCRSLNALAAAGMSILVHGASAGMLAGSWSDKHPAITLRGPVFAEAYASSLHHGKIALCFLRKINRDRITQRSVELPAMARPMLAEKTDEHDAHFVDGQEYLGFRDDKDLVAKARMLLNDPEHRRTLAVAGRQRCIASGYTKECRAQQMIDIIIEQCTEHQRIGDVLSTGRDAACQTFAEDFSTGYAHQSSSRKGGPRL